LSVEGKLKRVAEISGTSLKTTSSCSGRYLLENNKSSIEVNPLFGSDFEILDIKEAKVQPALSKIFNDYESSRPKGLNSFEASDGVYIHVKRNARVTLPLETCYFYTKKGSQVAENVID
jgi:hypothetical protein